MTGRTHDLAAITALGAVLLINPLPSVTLGTAIAALLANQIGGIFPDVDQPTAPFWRNLPVGSYFGKFFGKLSGGHRFLTHSLIGLVLSGLLARILLQFIHPLMPHIDDGLVWWAFMIGVVSHLVMDSFTEEGVPWLLPIPYKFGLPPIKSWRVKTGHWFEKLVIFPGLLAINIWFIASNYQHILEIVHSRLQ